MTNPKNPSPNSSTKYIQQQQHVTIRSAPLPPPEELIKYNEVIENGAERILKMAELQQQHRMKLEEKVISTQLKESLRGQIFGFLIGMSGIIGSLLIANNGFETAGSIIGGTSLVGLVSVFVLGKRNQKKNLEQKDI